jgi:putative hemolysin
MIYRPGSKSERNKFLLVWNTTFGAIRAKPKVLFTCCYRHFVLLNFMQALSKTRVSTQPVLKQGPPISIARLADDFPAFVSGRYEVRLAKNASETASALKLRHEVFKVELGRETASPTGSSLEFDAYDFKCRHLIVIDRDTGLTVGTYRLNTIETAGSTRGFYSANEFTIDDLPEDVLQRGIEIGRACISKEHRNTKVLFLLWKGLLRYLEHTGKRYFFGCCSIFETDAETGRKAFRQLHRDGHFHKRFSVKPIRNGLSLFDETDYKRLELPALFNMYFRLGARVCGPPMIDHEFGTIDFFVVFDVRRMNEKYRRMFS